MNKSTRAPVEQGKQFYGVVFNITAKGTASWDWYGPLFNNSQHREDWVYCTLTNAYFADSGCSSRMVFLHFSKKNQISTSILMYTVEFTLYYRVLRYRFPNGGLHTVSLQLKVLKSWNRNCRRNYCSLLITSSKDVNRRKMGHKSRETVSLDMNPFINGFIFK